jgi:hypothetical protein
MGDKCARCDDCGWVCEEHPYRPWQGVRACDCGAAGAPCPDCNTLKNGTPKGSFALSDPKSLCNDIAVASDGTASITDSFAPIVYSLKPGDASLEVWATNPLLAPAKDGVGLDGIAIGADGNIYVNTYIPAKLFRISAKDGKAGAVTELKPSRPLDHADAMRSFGNGFLLIEGNGKLDKVTVQGDEANIETVKDGLVEPVSVTQVGDIGWVAEGKLSYIIGDNKGKDPGPFALKPGRPAKVNGLRESAGSLARIVACARAKHKSRCLQIRNRLYAL